MTQDYLIAFKGSFTSALRWPHLEALWQRVRQQPQGWYIYAIGEPPPQQVASQDELIHFIESIDQLLKQEHQEEYCGIVYADDLEQPQMIKIYDPNNLGVSCGFSKNPPLPGWVLSRIPPIDIPDALPQTKSRQRWWQRLFKH